MTAKITVEEALRDVEERAAMLRYLFSLAAASEEHPDRTVLAGASEACSGIESLARASRESLDMPSLCRRLGKGSP